MTWLRRQAGVARTAIGADNRTIVIHYRDGQEAAILPKQTKTVRSGPSGALRPQIVSHDSVPANGRAIVLEPFADELDQGPDAGSTEAGYLSQAGYSVDILRNAQVTVPVMLGLAKYSFVYWNTHAGVLDDGDIVIVTGQVYNSSDYKQYYDNDSLIKAFVAGDDSKTLYHSITGKFVNLYIGQFPAHTTWFLNGCRGLDGDKFWSDIQGKGVDTLISWHQQAQSGQDDRAGQFVMSELTRGKSVAAAVNEALLEGYGLGIDNGTTAVLGYRGDGSMTLAESLTGTPPTPSASPTAIVTPTPTPKPKKPKIRLALTHRTLRAGARQVVTVHTVLFAGVTITVKFPNHKSKTHVGRADGKGIVRWKYSQPRGVTTRKSHTVKVTAEVKDAVGAENHSTKKYMAE